MIRYCSELPSILCDHCHWSLWYWNDHLQDGVKKIIAYTAHGKQCAFHIINNMHYLTYLYSSFAVWIYDVCSNVLHFILILLSILYWLAQNWHWISGDYYEKSATVEWLLNFLFTHLQQEQFSTRWLYSNDCDFFTDTLYWMFWRDLLTLFTSGKHFSDAPT